MPAGRLLTAAAGRRPGESPGQAIQFRLPAWRLTGERGQFPIRLLPPMVQLSSMNVARPADINGDSGLRTCYRRKLV